MERQSKYDKTDVDATIQPYALEVINRLAARGNLPLGHEGGELTAGDVVTILPQGVSGAELYGSGITTNIGVLHEKGHKKPWIIPMDAQPSRYTTLDYGMRWGIETAAPSASTSWSRCDTNSIRPQGVFGVLHRDHLAGAGAHAGSAISTRRFLARPSSLLLSATGFVLPYPRALSRAAATP